MGPPFEWSGELRFAGVASDSIPTSELKEALKSELARHQANEIEAAHDGVVFTAGPLRFVASFNALVAIDHGKVWIDQSAPDLVLKYKLSFVHVIVIASAVLLAIFFMEVFVTRDFTLKQAGLPMLVLWVWLCGGNLALGIYRFRSLLRHALVPALARRRTSPPRL